MMLKINGVSVKYNGRWVLKDLTLSLPRGGRLCLMGPSGCGKTTLLSLIMGLVAPAEGKIELSGEISCVFQENRLAEDFTPLRNLLLVHPDKARARALLEDLGLGDALEKRTSQLSGGMKRRVAIGRALLAGGDLLLMDEPFTGLDDSNRARVADVILRELGSRTLLFVSHDREEASLLGADIMEMTPQ